MKRQTNEYWEQMDGLMQEIDSSEKIFIGRDLNGHIRKKEYKRVHRGHDYEEKNDSANRILDFVMYFDPLVANIRFIKEEHSVTFTGGFNNSQIDFFLTKVIDRATC